MFKTDAILNCYNQHQNRIKNITVQLTINLMPVAIFQGVVNDTNMEIKGQQW